MRTATGAAMVLPHLGSDLHGAAMEGIAIETAGAKYVLDSKGCNRAFLDKRSGRNYCVSGPQYTFLSLKKNGRNYAPSKCSQSNGILTLEFAEAGVKAACRVVTHGNYFTVEVAEVHGEGIEELSLSNLCLDLSEHIGNMANIAWDGNFAAGVMALNLQAIAGGKSTDRALLWSACYPKLGMTGAKVAVLACPAAELRSTIQEIVTRHGLIRSPLGGAWALEAAENRYSYLFSYASESDIDDWIAAARSGGFKEILISEIGPYGQYNPYPERFPHGISGVRAVVDKVHAAGLRAGWHMLSFTIQKTDPWVTPIPDQRLATRNVLTLAEDLPADATFVPTLESPANLPTNSGFWFRGGMDILVGDEILTYSGLRSTPPFGLTQCTRGAYGTRAATHSRRAALRNLQEVFGTYVPEVGSSLMTDMKKRIASIVNTCGFDMIYMDGLDGADAFEGPEWAWYHGADFALSIFRQSVRPLQFEASAWYHHDWHITSRLGALDHPVRGQKRFVDYHVAANSHLDNLLPTQLGWWAFAAYQQRLALGTKREDIDYLCAKCLGTNSPLSLQEVTPQLLKKQPTWPALLALMGDYERLRLSNKVPEPVRSRLREPGQEFSLDVTGEQWQIRPMQSSQHKVTSIDGRANVIRVHNPLGDQAPRFRIQALLAAAPFDAPGDLVFEDFSSPESFAIRDNQSGVSASLEISHDPSKGGKTTALFRARNDGQARRRAWARVGRLFKPLFNMAQHPALGVWILGDGRGEVLNIQLLDPRGSDAAVDEHYVVVDFTGWQYCELVEPEGTRWSDYEWPYRNPLAACREIVDQSQIAQLNLYYNNLPPGETIACRIGAIKALPVEPVRIERPRLTLAGNTLVFPVALETGCYLELRSPKDCKLHDPNGAVLQEVRPEGTWPVFHAGANTLVFECEPPAGRNARAMVTTFLSGPPILAGVASEKFVE
jgi:hypothetical protein